MTDGTIQGLEYGQGATARVGEADRVQGGLGMLGERMEDPLSHALGGGAGWKEGTSG